jgi:BirA family biotin operon repressor/biotin-[acetyl-CoA-carboxylase] ligase
VPDDRWTDLDRPPLREAALRGALLDGSGPWTDLRVVRATGSTNADVAEAAGRGAPAGLVLVAEEQTAGRGRLGRAWTAPARSGLTFSVLLRPDLPRPAWSWLGLLVGLGAAEAVGRLGGLEVGLKWPNDVLVGERKLAGVLAEVAGDAVVVGMGLNVSLRAGERPVPSATSLALEDSTTTDRDPVLRAVLRGVGSWYERLQAAGDADAAGLRRAYRERCVTLGREVRVELPAGPPVAGVAEDVDPAGRLLVGGCAVSAGDVVHVR